MTCKGICPRYKAQKPVGTGRYEKEVDEYFKIYGKVFNFIRTKLHNKFNILRMMPDLLSIFRYMKKNEERFGMEINMRDLMKVAKA